MAVGETLSARLLTALLGKRGRPAAFRDVLEVLRHRRPARPRPAGPAGPARGLRPLAGGAWPGCPVGDPGLSGQGPGRCGHHPGPGRLRHHRHPAGGGPRCGGGADLERRGRHPQRRPQPGARRPADPTAEPARGRGPVGLRGQGAACRFPRPGGPGRVPPGAGQHPAGPDRGRTEIRLQAPAREPGEITSVAYKEGVCCLRLPPAQESDLFERMFQAANRLQEAGASLYGLLATPDGGLLVARAERRTARRCCATWRPRTWPSSGAGPWSPWSGKASGLPPAVPWACSPPWKANRSRPSLLGTRVFRSRSWSLKPDWVNSFPELHRHCVEKVALI